MNSHDSESHKNRYNKKKKRKRKFVCNAKGFGKKGIYGRGTHLESDQYEYFVNVLDTLGSGFEDLEEKVIMANNVFKQTEANEIHLSTNQVVCRVLEALIAFVDAEHLERFFNAFGENLRPICSDTFGSHVLQKLIEIAFLRAVDATEADTAAKVQFDESTATKRQKQDLQNEENFNRNTTFQDEHKEKCKQFVLRVGKFMLNNLECFVWDTCGNHIMRTCILVLAGVYMPKEAFNEKPKGQILSKKKIFPVPDEWLDVMKEYAQRLEMWPQFGDLPYREHPSALLGVICIALKVVDKRLLKRFGKQILEQSFLKSQDHDDDDNDNDDKGKALAMSACDEEHPQETEDKKELNKIDLDSSTSVSSVKLPKVFGNICSIRLLETLLEVAKPKLATQLFAKLFLGHLGTLAADKRTNFAVQKLLLYHKEAEDFKMIFEELIEHIEKLLNLQITGVIEALTAACLRLGCMQSRMIVALQTALHVPSRDKEKSNLFFMCLVKLKPVDVVDNDTSDYVHLHGSLIVQHCLKFNKPIYLVNSILATPPDQLVSIFNKPNGSYIVEAYMQSKFIGEKSREKLIRLLEGFYVDLAVTRVGSFVIETLIEASQDVQKERIAKELSSKINLLNGTPYGRLLYNKLDIATFKISPAQWKSSPKMKGKQVKSLL